MSKVIALLIVVICALSVLAGSSQPSEPSTSRQQSSQSMPTDQQRAINAIKVTIAMVAPLLDSPTSRYRVGEQVPVTISLTNTSSEPAYVSVSSDLYQDRPRLTKDGQVAPYTKWQTYLLQNTRKDQTCVHEDMPEELLLRSNEPTVVDFLIVVDDPQAPTGALSWYDPLTPGVYELSIQRRFGYCDGPMVESNKISFEVVP